MGQIRDGIAEAKEAQAELRRPGRARRWSSAQPRHSDAAILTTASHLYSNYNLRPCLLLRLQPDSVFRRPTAARSRAAGPRASAVSGRLARAILWIRCVGADGARVSRIYRLNRIRNSSGRSATGIASLLT